MSFHSKRLRVQLPCGEGETVVEAADDAQAAFPFVQQLDYRYAECSTITKHDLPCMLFATCCLKFGTHKHEVDVIVESVQLAPEQLPLFREALKLQLAQAEQTRRQIEARLQDIDAAEQQLKERED